MADIELVTPDPFEGLLGAAEAIGAPAPQVQAPDQPVQEPQLPTIEQPTVTPREVNFDTVQLTDLQDIDTMKRVTDFETLDQAKFAMWKADLNRTRAATEIAIPEAGNTLRTAAESLYYGTGINLTRVGAALFGDALVSPATGRFIRGFKDPETGFEAPGILPKIPGNELEHEVASALLTAGAESFGKFMRGVFWSWHDKAEDALVEARTSRDFDPDKFSSAFGEATGSVLGSIGSVMALGFLGVGATAATGVTVEGFATVETLNEYDEALAEGATTKEALAWGLLKGRVTSRAERLGLGWLLRNHGSSVSRIVDATVGEGFEEIVERVGGYAVDELAAVFERTAVKEGGIRTNTVYGNRLLRTWDDWQDAFAEGLYAAAIASMASGTVNFAVGGHAYKQARQDLQVAGVTPEDAQQIVEEAMVRVMTQTQGDISVQEGIDYDTIELTNQKLDSLLGPKFTKTPGEVPATTVPVRTEVVIEQDDAINGRVRAIQQELNIEAQAAAQEAEIAEPTEQQVQTQFKRADKIYELQLEQEVLQSGKAVFATDQEIRSLKEQGYEPVAVSQGKQIMIPASTLLRAQENVARKSVAAYKRGAQEATSALNKEGVAARRALRDYIKSYEGLEAADKTRLMERLTNVKNGQDFNRVLPQIEFRMNQQLSRRRVQALKSSTDELVRRYRRRKDVDVESKKVFEKIEQIRKDPSVRQSVLEQAIEEGATPEDTNVFIEQMMARYYSGLATTEAELRQIHEVLQTFYSRGATEANRLAAERAKRHEQTIKNLLQEIDAPALTAQEELVGRVERPNRTGIFTPVTMLNEANLNFDAIMRLIVSERPEVQSEFLENLGLFNAQMTQYALQGESKEQMENSYQQAYKLRSSYQMADMMQNEARPLPEPMGLPKYNENGDLVQVVPISIAEARTIWTYWQNVKARKSLQKAGITEEAVTHIQENILVEEDIIFIQETQKVMHELYEKTKPIYERLTTKPLGFEEFYLPLIVAEEETVATSQSHLVDQMLSLRQDVLNRGYHSPSQTKSRLGGRAAVIRPDHQIVTKYIRDMSHFIGMAETMDKLTTVFGDKRVRNAVKKKYGDKRMASIDLAIDRMGKNSTWSNQQKIWESYTRFINNIALGAIKASGFKLGEKQLISAFAAMPDVSFGEFVNGWATLPQAIKSKEINVLMEHPYFKFRGWKSFDAAMRLIQDSATDLGQPISPKMRVDDFLTMSMQVGDKGGLVASTWIMYNAYKKQGMSKPEALNKAFEASNTAQQSPFMSQIPVGALEGNAVVNTYVKFKSAPSQFFNNVYVAAAEYAGAKSRAKDKGFGEAVKAATTGPEAKRFAKTMLWYFVLQPAMYNFISNGFQLDREDQVAYTLLGPYASLILLGDVFLNSVQLGVIMTAALRGKEGARKDFWKFRNRLADKTIMISWFQSMADIMNLIAKTAEEGSISADESFELMQDLGRVTSAKDPTVGAAIQQAGRVLQATGDLGKGDYNDAFKRYQGFTNYVVEQSGNDDKIKKGRSSVLNVLK